MSDLLLFELYLTVWSVSSDCRWFNADRLKTCCRCMGSLCDNISNPVTAVAMLFGTYYVMNLHYPEGAAITLEFIQRYFCFQLPIFSGIFSYCYLAANVCSTFTLCIMCKRRLLPAYANSAIHPSSLCKWVAVSSSFGCKGLRQGMTCVTGKTVWSLVMEVSRLETVFSVLISS